jgi:hypothetical protein
MDGFNETFGALYIWDEMEKRGFPVTKDVMILDIDELSWEQKQILSAGSEMEISELAKKEGQELISFVMMGANIFAKLMQVVFMNESPEKRKEISNLIRSTMKEMADEWDDDAN